jgi:hypothetical protein
MQRREHVTFFGGVAALPVLANARPNTMARALFPAPRQLLDVLRDKMLRLGYVEGGNLAIECRWERSRRKIVRLGRWIGAARAQCNRDDGYAGHPCGQACEQRHPNCVRVEWQPCQCEIVASFSRPATSMVKWW